MLYRVEILYHKDLASLASLYAAERGFEKKMVAKNLSPFVTLFFSKQNLTPFKNLFFFGCQK